MGRFLVKANRPLSDLKVGEILEESDFAQMCPDGQFVQLEYQETENKRDPYIVTPGLWSIEKEFSKLTLKQTELIKDVILEEFLHTKDISGKIEMFFNKLDVYKKYGIDIPKRAALLFGPPGSGKTATLNKISMEHVKDGKTAVIMWTTDKFESYEVSDFFKSFEYKDVEKVILVAEDIGGVEMEEVRRGSDSSLLSFLDNKERAFKLPTFILATTNFPEVFMANLTNRPGRFDDKIKVGFPDVSQREQLFKFFAKDETIDNKALDVLKSIKCKDFSPAHIKEIFIRAAIYDKTQSLVIEELSKEIEDFNKGFQKKNKVGMGIGSSFEDD